MKNYHDIYNLVSEGRIVTIYYHGDKETSYFKGSDGMIRQRYHDKMSIPFNGSSVELSHSIISRIEIIY